MAIFTEIQSHIIGVKHDLRETAASQCYSHTEIVRSISEICRL